MLLIDLLLKPVDSYWHRRYKEEQILRQRAETNARYAEKKMRYQDEDFSKMLMKDAAQAKTISAFSADRQGLLDEIEDLRAEIEGYDATMKVLRDLIRTQKETIFALKALGLKKEDAE